MTKDYDFYFTFPNLDESGIEMDKVYTLDDKMYNVAGQPIK